MYQRVLSICRILLIMDKMLLSRLLKIIRVLIAGRYPNFLKEGKKEVKKMEKKTSKYRLWANKM
jgi:hypothetical protein